MQPLEHRDPFASFFGEGFLPPGRHLRIEPTMRHTGLLRVPELTGLHRLRDPCKRAVQGRDEPAGFGVRPQDPILPSAPHHLKGQIGEAVAIGVGGQKTLCPPMLTRRKDTLFDVRSCGWGRHRPPREAVHHLSMAHPKPLALDACTHGFWIWGNSANGAFCDGSPRGRGKPPHILKLDEQKTNYPCGWDISCHRPRGDGSHNKRQS